MATYIPQVQGYIPQYQPFKPDFNFYAGALQMKQSQYDSAHKQLSTLYTSLLNSPLTRDGNVQKRDDIFNMINQDIKKISSVDLSLAGKGIGSGQYCFMVPPICTTAQRNLITPVAGALIYNSTLKRLEIHNGSGWSGIVTTP